ncbi:DNA polymerase interacting tpr containing protein of 47kD [Rhodnius prolixus]|uniref:Cns1/TTC4 wheel domain-containing protein n=2 Tax=Rhodnius TaxID=13248 RepID=T1IDW4_RHOPR
MDNKSARSEKFETEEVRELAEKLDRELEDYILNLEKRSSNEAWPEDRWQEEMEKHPFFMTKVPEDGEIPPLLQGLQELKFSPEENTPEDLARAYKEDGNYHYKLKKYRIAILCYTEGIKQRSNDVELNGHLYNNRAAAHYFLGNYRSCYNDCKCAVRILPLYPKATSRLAQVCFKLGLYEECISNCDLLTLENEPENKEILELRKAATKKKKEKECAERRNNLLEKKIAIENKKILAAIKERKIKLVDQSVKENEELGLSNDLLAKKVHFCGERLVWPVLLLYPEYETSDIIENFHEDHTFEEELSEIFSNFADWDVDHKYSVNTISVYYENEKNIKSINLSATLGAVLVGKEVENGMPSFLVLLKDSATEKKLLKR